MIQYFNWLPQLEALPYVDSIENELVLFQYSEIKRALLDSKPANYELMRTPHKFDFFMFVNHTHGSVKAKIDMEEYIVDGPYNVVHIAPGQILSLENVSADFDAHVIIMSKRFIESLMVFTNGSVPLRIGAFRSSPIEHYDVEEDMTFEFIYRAVRNCLKDRNNPYRLQVVQHIIMALFYSSERMREVEEAEGPRSNADVLSKEFLTQVKEHFRRERQLKFYADKLCITPRYLSRVVKESTGSSAAEWIERCVVLEARALLKSTNMTIQQISDELNFPSQTFFGKYFKRRVGMSPKEYRRVG